MKKYRIRICGRNTITAPTPPITPSTSMSFTGPSGIVVLMNLFLIVVRRQVLVVEMELRSATMRFVTRGIAKRTAKTTDVPLAELKWVRYKTAAISPIPNYKGYRFYANNKLIGDLFVDHFTWDDRQRQVKDFLADLNERVPIRAF